MDDRRTGRRNAEEVSCERPQKDAREGLETWIIANQDLKTLNNFPHRILSFFFLVQKRCNNVIFVVFSPTVEKTGVIFNSR